MMLTGKAKEDFYKFLIKDYPLNENEVEKWFMSLYNEFKNALIIEWFDYVGIWSNVVNDTLIFDRYYFKKCSWRSNIELLLITANEIYNSK